MKKHFTKKLTFDGKSPEYLADISWYRRRCTSRRLKGRRPPHYCTANCTAEVHPKLSNVIVLYWVVLFCFVLFCFVLFCFVLFCFVLFCFVLHCIVLYCIVLYCIVLFCIVLHCIVLHCIVLYCIVLYCITSEITTYLNLAHDTLFKDYSKNQAIMSKLCKLSLINEHAN